MKTLNNFIAERLKINKDIKINETIPTKFSKDIKYTQNEIDIVQKYAEQLKIKPIILTNYQYNDTHQKLVGFDKYIFMYFDDDWNNCKLNGLNNYIYIKKSFLYNEWEGWIVMKENNLRYIQNKNNSLLCSKNIEDICKELLKQLPNTDFYDEVKNI